VRIGIYSLLMIMGVPQYVIGVGIIVVKTSASFARSDPVKKHRPTILYTAFLCVLSNVSEEIE